jgi:dienelactone hydrolase
MERRAARFRPAERSPVPEEAANDNTMCSSSLRMVWEGDAMTTERTGSAAGVPYLALPPPEGVERPSLVVVLHMMDPPRGEAAMAAALPLGRVPAWRAYLGLPMFGARMLEGGPDAFMRLAMEDPLLKLQAPVIEQAAAELPAAVEALQEELELEDRRVALVGGSAGAGAVLLALAETDVPADVVVLVNPVARVASAIEAGERAFGMSYEWNDERDEKAAQLDFVRRANEVAARDPQPPVLIVQGEKDDEAFVTGSNDLRQALEEAYRDRGDVSLVRVSGLAHALANEPGVDAAPQTEGATIVDAEAAKLLEDRLG